ncbi:MAG TPA: hypothetical protein VLM79_21840, partial [Kofleriaceae bacterium]|nr:hypothetical protein [Kofleriaceae bacterium]
MPARLAVSMFTRWPSMLALALAMVPFNLAILAGGTACGSHDTAKAAGAPDEPAGEPAEPVQRPGTVTLTPEQAKNSRIQLGAVERRSEAGLLAATAQIEAPANGIARVA